MPKFDLKIQISTDAARRAFLTELQRSEKLHVNSYKTKQLEPGLFTLHLNKDAPHSGGFPNVFMNIQDFMTTYNDSTDSGSTYSKGSQFGVYENSDGQLWIDGSWVKGYGEFKVKDRNRRVEFKVKDRNRRVEAAGQAAGQAFPNAKIHSSPYCLSGWKLLD